MAELITPGGGTGRPGVLLRLQEARHSLILGAMLSCDERRVVDIAAVPYLRRGSIALQQKRLCRCAAGSKAAGQDEEGYPPRDHPLEATPPRINGKA